MNEDTIVIMVSIGERSHLTDFSFPRLSKWASKHGYSSILLKKAYNPLNRAPHFNKLQVHKLLPNFKRFIIVDDDLLLSIDAPAMESVPTGHIGLCRDSEQRHTEAKHVTWTANTGFIVFEREAAYLLDEAYEKGEHQFEYLDGSKKSIWGPHDQGIVNDVLFRNKKVFELNYKWNYQPVLEFFINGKDWTEWQNNKLYRLAYYSSLISPFPNKNKRAIKNAYGLHLIRAPYPAFFSKIFK